MPFIHRPLADLQAWTRHIARAEVPVLESTETALAAMAAKQDEVAPRDIAAVVLADPLMTLKVLVWAGARRRAKAHTISAEVETVEGGLVLMGVSPFFRHFQRLHVVERRLIDHPAALDGLMRVLARSRVAAEYAGEWAASRKDLDIQVIFEAALLHDLAEMLVWCFAPMLALRMQAMRREFPSMRSIDIQRSVLGIGLNELEVEAFRVWRLPRLLKQLTDDTHTAHPAVRNVVLAANLARHLANGRDDPALPDDYAAIGALLGLPAQMVEERIRCDDRAEAPPIPPSGIAMPRST